MKMKSKITSFIMCLMTIFMIAIVVFLAIIIYNEFIGNNIVNEVQEFVSNITISGTQSNSNAQIPEIVELEKNETEINENISESNKANFYYYNQLDDYSKIIYNAIIENKENMKLGNYVIDLGTQFSQLLSEPNGEQLLGQYYQAAIESYKYDNPDVFYIEFSKLCLNIETTTRGFKKTYKTFINSGNNQNYLTNEFPSKERIDSAINEVDKIRAYFIQNKQSDIYENIKLIHNYLVESIEYDQSISEPDIYDIYGALINKKSVCEGYAKAFKYLMDSVDIPCVIVTGEATNSDGKTESHAWNYVKLNGSWYAIDCTWDDPILIGTGFLTNSTKYEYFLKGENEFNENHIPNGQFTENGKIFQFPTLSQNNY